MRSIKRILRNLSFIFKYDLNNCFKSHNDEIDRLIEWNKNICEDLEEMRQGAREMFSMQDDEFKSLKKQLATQKARVTRQTNEQNAERLQNLETFDLVLRKLEALEKRCK